MVVGQKYGNRKTVVDGIKFDSKAEAGRYRQLKMMQDSGEITNLELQKRFVLTPSRKLSNGKTERASHYVADFYYVTEDGEHITEDVKGSRKGAAYQMFALKRKLMLDKHDIEILETK